MKSSTQEKYKFKIALRWFKHNQWKPFPFQLETWNAFLEGKSGLLNAPTGSGKTYALWIPSVLQLLELQNFDLNRSPTGLQVIWITPLRALAKDIQKALLQFCNHLGLTWQIDTRTGDTPTNLRAKQLQKAPTCLITTPESLHIIFSQKKSIDFFKNVKIIIADEWHELIGTKRGVQTELAISRIRNLSRFNLKIWGISATIGNISEAARVLTGADGNPVIVKAQIEKKTEIETIIPEKLDRFPWAGHLGLKLLPQVLPIIAKSKTTLLFTNTRSQTELWYRGILNVKPELAGTMAMHHGSIDNNIRLWVEDALSTGKLKLVVCTSSLDLGVDFSPVDTIIQVGGPKGVSRFMQRAGRSGHQPGGLSKIYFVPTHSLELVEGAALRTAEKNKIHENRSPIEGSLDVLVQYLITLSVGPGFEKREAWKEVRNTFAYRNLPRKEWNWALDFITSGGRSLSNYSEYSKVNFHNGLYKVLNRRTMTKHRLSIGTIVGDPILKVRYNSGGYLGTIEESFISSLNPGDIFWFSGRPLEFIKLKDMTVYVAKSKRKGGKIPAWGGGRLPLSSKLADLIRQKLENAKNGIFEEIEMIKLKSTLELQQKWSEIPGSSTLLIEKTSSDNGHHIFIYPFEGRFVHEILSALIAHRIGKILPITFSIAMNDYGFELLSDQIIPIEEALESNLFSLENLVEHMEECINNAGLAKMKFRDIATIAGLIFKGYPGKFISNKHLQSSSGLLYEVFNHYDPDNLLLKQAKEEVVTLQLDYQRLLDAMKRINQQKIILKETERFTPFAFPIMADGLRQKMTSEKVSDQLLRLQKQLEILAN
ncbi:MAG: ligase-associated DNA damage response DEXH box helicase [Cytophagales bacterium]|nr:ligase-associated DNA damage response DEXH box helicase [Cytophagales bacterium]